MTALIFMLHLASCLYMTGLIWFVQVVHYPLHGHVGLEQFVQYQNLHMSKTTFVVGPPMLIEALTTVLILMNAPDVIPIWSRWVGAVLLGIVWLSTAVFSVQFHNALLDGFEAKAHHMLVSTNWIRTLGWTLRGALAVWMTSLLFDAQHFAG